MANAPVVMVSSTYYDLRQVRTDLERFLTELGYQPLLSEYDSFPVDPDAGLVENCRRRVEREADVLVLVIGGRYGSVDEPSSKSVTNLEYLVARAKGIPIYAFVEKNVLALLPTWEQNPDADFSRTVDSSELFEFVRQVRSVDQVWTFPFERAQDITATLRTQFAYLMREGLQWRLQVRKQPEVLATKLRGQSLRLALEQPTAWEFRLVGQTLCDEVEENNELRREQQTGLSLGLGEHVPLTDTAKWMQMRMEELRRIVNGIETLVNTHLKEALGPPGTPGDVKAIAFVTRQIGAAYRHALEWAQRVRRAHVHELFRPAANEMALLADSVIRSVEAYGPEILKQVDDALSAPAEEKPKTLTMTGVAQKVPI